MKLKYFILLCLSYFISSCGLYFKTYLNSITVECGSIPDDFGSPESGILIVKDGNEANDKYLMKCFKKYYFGDYTLISKSL